MITKCVICGKPTSSTLSAYPYRHGKRGEPNFCCELCWRAFVDEADATHKRRLKLDEKKFVPIVTREWDPSSRKFRKIK
jgi:hypothetical protein